MDGSFGRKARHDLRRPLFWLGAVLPVCFIAGITGATIPTQLPLLSIVLGFVLWRRGIVTTYHRLGIVFVAYACVATIWSPNPMFAVYGLWQVMVWGLAFWLGSTSPSLAPLWRGMAVGLGVSSMVAVAQSLGWQGIPSRDWPAGLLYSGPLQGAMIALVMVATICDRAFLYIPAMLPGLLLSHSRGAALVLVVTTLSRLHWGAGVATVAAAATIGAVMLGPSDVERLQSWSVALHNITPFGLGTGSFEQVIYAAQGVVVHPEFVHNDYLQLAFEYGVGAIPALAILVAALRCSYRRYWPVLVGFCTLGLFYFPLYCAPLAFIGAVAAGHVLRRDDRARVPRYRGRPPVMAWIQEAWREAFPVPPRNPPESIGAVDAAR